LGRADHPLAGCRAKLDRAREHLEQLVGDFEAMQAEIHDLRLVGAMNWEAGEWEISAFEVPELPMRWATIIGDVVHNARSALDHLVWVFAVVSTGGSPAPNTGFPAATSAAGFETIRKQDRLLKGLSDAHVEFVQSHQPYHAENPKAECSRGPRRSVE
jgi:hypothetical protein